MPIVTEAELNARLSTLADELRGYAQALVSSLSNVSTGAAAASPAQPGSGLTGAAIPGQPATLAAKFRDLGFLPLSSDENTTSHGAFVDVPGMSFTMTIAAGGGELLVRCSFSGVTLGAGADAAILQLSVVDSSAVIHDSNAFTSNLGAAPSDPLAVGAEWLFPALPAGLTTIKLRWSCLNGGGGAGILCRALSDPNAQAATLTAILTA